MPNLTDAIAVCRLIEPLCPAHGCHVALTGGTLYKDGERKDIDLLFYNIRQVETLDLTGLLDALRSVGVIIGKRQGWIFKAALGSFSLDLMFPELVPSSDAPSTPGTY